MLPDPCINRIEIVHISQSMTIIRGDKNKSYFMMAARIV